MAGREGACCAKSRRRILSSTYFPAESPITDAQPFTFGTTNQTFGSHFSKSPALAWALVFARPLPTHELRKSHRANRRDFWNKKSSCDTCSKTQNAVVSLRETNQRRTINHVSLSLPNHYICTDKPPLARRDAPIAFI